MAMPAPMPAPTSAPIPAPMALALPIAAALALGGCHRQAPAPPQPKVEAAPAPAAPVTGPSRANAGKAAPSARFTDLADGTDKTLADFKGKPLLVNLWATWCAPCVRELPALDALAKARSGRLTVLAISQDQEGTKVVQPFLAAHGIGLHPYHDRDNALMLATREAGLPVTILYGADGKEVWRVAGDFDWQGAKAKALLAEAGA